MEKASENAAISWNRPNPALTFERQIHTVSYSRNNPVQRNRRKSHLGRIVERGLSMKRLMVDAKCPGSVRVPADAKLHKVILLSLIHIWPRASQAAETLVALKGHDRGVLWVACRKCGEFGRWLQPLRGVFSAISPGNRPLSAACSTPASSRLSKPGPAGLVAFFPLDGSSPLDSSDTL